MQLIVFALCTIALVADIVTLKRIQNERKTLENVIDKVNAEAGEIRNESV